MVSRSLSSWSRTWIRGILLLGWIGAVGDGALAGEVLTVRACDDSDTDVTNDLKSALKNCDDDTIILPCNSDCVLKGVTPDGDCTIKSDASPTSCSVKLTNQNEIPAVLLDGTSLTIEGLTLYCTPESSGTSVLNPVRSTVTITNSTLDGTSCKSGALDDKKEDEPSQITISGSLLTGAAISLNYGATSLIIEDSILKSADGQLTSTLSGKDIATVSIKRSALLAASDDATAISLSGVVMLSLQNNLVNVSSSKAAFTLSTTDAYVMNNTFLTSDAATGPAIDVTAGTLDLAQNLFTAFSTAITSSEATLASSDDVWVEIDAISSDDSLIATSIAMSDAGLSELGDQTVCLLPPTCANSDDCDDEVCFETLKIWPEDGCSAIVLTPEDGASPVLAGLAGGDFTDAPWEGAVGDSDGDSDDDDDGDGWVDDLDELPENKSYYRPSWYARLDGAAECDYKYNLCDDDPSLTVDYKTFDVESDEGPEECANKPEPPDCDGPTPPETGCIGEQGSTYTGGRGCGMIEVSSAWILGIGLPLLGLRARRRRSR